MELSRLVKRHYAPLASQYFKVELHYDLNLQYTQSNMLNTLIEERAFK